MILRLVSPGHVAEQLQASDVFDQWCLRRILNIAWSECVMNFEVRRRTGQPLLSDTVWYSTEGLNVQLDLLHIISGTILWVRQPDQQCHSTEGQ